MLLAAAAVAVKKGSDVAVAASSSSNNFRCKCLQAYTTPPPGVWFSFVPRTVTADTCEKAPEPNTRSTLRISCGWINRMVLFVLRVRRDLESMTWTR